MLIKDKFLELIDFIGFDPYNSTDHMWKHYRYIDQNYIWEIKVGQGESMKYILDKSIHSLAKVKKPEPIIDRFGSLYGDISEQTIELFKGIFKDIIRCHNLRGILYVK